jgi:hypothetical protein
MSALACKLAEIGATLLIVDSKRNVLAPEGSLTPALKAEIRKQRSGLLLSCFQDEVRSCLSLAELETCVLSFSAHQWTIIERADMSSSYTPTACRLIEHEAADKWRTLEQLASLCWNPNEHQNDDR